MVINQLTDGLEWFLCTGSGFACTRSGFSIPEVVCIYYEYTGSGLYILGVVLYMLVVG